MKRKAESLVMAKDRRTTPRCSPLHEGGKLTAEVRMGSHPPYVARVVNISREGTLLEFQKPNLPRVRVDEHITLKLWIHEDVIWLPGIVRHCYAKRIGVFFPRSMGKSIPNSRQILNKILRDPGSRNLSHQAG